MVDPGNMDECLHDATYSIRIDLGLWTWATCLLIPQIIAPSIDLAFCIAIALVLIILGKRLFSPGIAVPGWRWLALSCLCVRVLSIAIAIAISAFLAGTYASWIESTVPKGEQSIFTSKYAPRAVFCAASVILIFIPFAWPTRKLLQYKNDILKQVAANYAKL